MLYLLYGKQFCCLQCDKRHHSTFYQRIHMALLALRLRARGASEKSFLTH